MELEDFSRTHIIQNTYSIYFPNPEPGVNYTVYLVILYIFVRTVCRGAFSHFAKSELLGEKFGIKTSGFPGFGIPDWDWELGLNCGKGKKLPEKLLEKK